MDSIELMFNNKRNIRSTHPPSIRSMSTHLECPSKTKSKALLSIVRRIQNPQRHHEFFHHRRPPLCRYHPTKRHQNRIQINENELARDTSGTIGMSAEVERVFSGLVLRFVSF